MLQLLNVLGMSVLGSIGIIGLGAYAVYLGEASLRTRTCHFAGWSALMLASLVGMQVYQLAKPEPLPVEKSYWDIYRDSGEGTIYGGSGEGSCVVLSEGNIRCVSR